MEIEIDRHPVSDLPSRYGISRSVLYSRMQKIGVQTIKEGNKSFVSKEDVETLDRLNEHIKVHGNINDFLDQTDRTDTQDRQDGLTKVSDNGSYLVREDRTDGQDRQDGQPQQLDIPNLMEQLVDVAVSAIERREKTSINDLRTLQEIADNGWLIPTSRLAEIIGKTRSFFRGKKSTITYCGFKFEKVGKQGNDKLWLVSRS